LWSRTLLPAVPGLPLAMSWAGMVFDLAIPFLLLDRRTRLPSWLVLVFFHVVTGVLFNIGVFPVLMVAASTVFFEADWPRRWRVFAWCRIADTATCAIRTPHRLSSPQTATLLAIAAFQLLFPLRNLLYPGNPLWHEQGFRLGWRVLLVEKTGFVEYEVRHPATGRVWKIDPGDELTPMQAKSMATQPDLLLAYAHHLRDRFAADGIAPVEVRADAWATLNGRRPQRLLDPTVDLAAERQSFWNQPFILPLGPGSPP
jgi:vitamin K-dependent gamma-carboxylase